MGLERGSHFTDTSKNREKEMHVCSVLRQLFILTQSTPPNEGLGPHTFRLCLSISVKTMEKLPHRHDYRPTWSRQCLTFFSRLCQVDNSNWSSHVSMVKQLKEKFTSATWQRELSNRSVRFRHCVQVWGGNKSCKFLISMNIKHLGYNFLTAQRPPVPFVD